MTRDNFADLSRATKSLLFKNPFYGLFLMTLNKKFKTNIQTACVTKEGIHEALWIGEEFWWSLPDNHKVGVLQHETLHICFGHLFTFQEYRDRDIANLAFDCEVNSYIENDMLPDWVVRHTKFPELKLEPKMGSKYYYEALAKEKQKGDKMCQSLKNALAGAEDLHKSWKQFEDLTEAEKRLMEKQLEGQLKQVAEGMKDRGTIPGEMQGILSGFDITEEPVFDWKGYFRRFTGYSTKLKFKTTRMKPNKRFPDNPAVKFKKLNHILIAFDTSGSVSDSELVEFLQETHHIWRGGIEISLMQCDSEMHLPEPYKGKVSEFEVKGRGGTVFDPVVNYFNEHPEYSALVYFTDGEAPAPQNPPRAKMLWVISSRGTDQYVKDYPAQIIQIPKKGGD